MTLDIEFFYVTIADVFEPVRALQAHLRYILGYEPKKIRIMYDPLHMDLPCQRCEVPIRNLHGYLSYMSHMHAGAEFEGCDTIVLHEDLILTSILFEMNAARMYEIHREAIAV